MRSDLYLFFLLAAMFPLAGSAQSFTFFSVDTKPAHFGELVRSSNTVELNLPVIRQIENQLLVSPQYQSLILKEGYPFDENNFYSLSLRLIWQHRLNGRWKLTSLFVPTISSANGNFSGDAFFATGGLRLAFVQNSQLSWQVGAVYSYRFHGNLLIPLLGFRWSPRPGVELLADLPMRIRSTWTISSFWQTGISLVGNPQMSLVPGYSNFDYFWYRERNLIWSSDFRLIRNWWLSPGAGYCLKSDFKLCQKPEQGTWSFGTNVTGSGNKAVWESSENGFFVKLGLSYRISQ